jgi:hypothetical protein
VVTRITTCFYAADPKLRIMSSQCIYVFRLFVKINSRFYDVPVVVDNREAVCLLWSRNWIFTNSVYVSDPRGITFIDISDWKQRVQWLTSITSNKYSTEGWFLYHWANVDHVKNLLHEGICSTSFGHKQLTQNVWKLKQNIFTAAFLIRNKDPFYPRHHALFSRRNFLNLINRSRSAGDSNSVSLKQETHKYHRYLGSRIRAWFLIRRFVLNFYSSHLSLSKYLYMDFHNSLSQDFQ